MSGIHAEIKNKIQNYDDSIKFIEKWINYLELTPWADTECLFDNLQYENAISWPFYCVHYETEMEEGFKLKTHTMWNENENRPGTEHLLRLADILEIDLRAFNKKVMEMPNNFHEKFYIGHRYEDRAEPPMNQIFQRLMDDTLMVAYKTERENGRRNSKEVDVAITVCLRVDNLFSNKPIEINIENFVQANETFVLQLGCLSFQQLGVTSTQREDGSWKRCIGESRQRTRNLEAMAKQKLNKRYKNQKHRKKEEIAYEKTSEDARSRKWLNDIRYPTNSKKVKL